ncbi:MAG TPA: peptidase M61 [Chitinophagaceae bacterium]|nr:peptidase M61 [Chitinophagaceae bacterium]
MKLNYAFFLLFFLQAFLTSVSGQNSYKYSVDLTKLKNDELSIELITPKVKKSEIIFYMPKIIPGTYRNSDFGKFVKNVKAFDKAGKSLPVMMLADSNGWKIKNANLLYKIKYNVEDTWDASYRHNVFEMAGTNFEEGKNFSINTCGIFGYLDGMKKIPFDFTITRPANFFASTALVPVSSSANTDVFRCENVDQLYDSPIMFCVPDTTTVKVGATDILVSVYSPKKLITSKFIAANLKSLLFAAKNYLGGKLPVARYAFIYYFNSEQPLVKGEGALEHPYSSFYSLPEEPEQLAITQIVDVSSHEFFHIITPLSICSREVREFNFNRTVLSKHLWLYEGSTEYDAHHTQVTQGLISPEEYLRRLSQKISFSKRFFKDTLSFTELSVNSADKYNDQFINVYQKGALINACLDIYLNKLSGGNYGVHNLKHDLSIRYGPTNYFKDDELFDEITKITFPEVREYFRKYVEGNTPIPYDEFFALVGIKYNTKKDVKVFSDGGFAYRRGGDGVVITSVANLNEFGKRMGYQIDDEIISFNNEAVTPSSFRGILAKFASSAKEGDIVTVQVKRKNAAGEKEIVTLSAPAIKVVRTLENVLEFDNTAGEEQLKIRNAWLNSPCRK